LNWRKSDLKPEFKRFSFIRPIVKLWSYQELIWNLIKREISQRYKGTFLGFIWAWVVPLLMLIIYTFVFSVIFKAKWRPGESQLGEFAITLFAGLIAFNIFSEIANSAPGVIVAVPNYVKKVIFPLEILPIVKLGSALINSLISVLILILINFIITKTISPMIILLPLAYLPLIFLCLGTGWLLSSLGVYIRDLSQAIGVITQILFFLSPVCYPIEAAPQSVRFLLEANPLTIILTTFRQSLIWGETFPWKPWIAWLVFDFSLAVVGYAWFVKTKKGFADVL
jgi:lipopolysaccharide transport system permease protein